MLISNSEVSEYFYKNNINWTCNKTMKNDKVRLKQVREKYIMQEINNTTLKFSLQYILFYFGLGLRIGTEMLQLWRPS